MNDMTVSELINMGRDWLEHAPEAPKNSDPNLLGFTGRVGFVCRDCMFRMSGRGCNTNALATEPVYKPTILKTFCVFCGPRSMTNDEKKCADDFFLSRFYHQPEPTPDEKIKHLERANSILRAAMYDIADYDTDGDEIAYCGQMAKEALAKSALDKNGRLAGPSNAPHEPPAH